MTLQIRPITIADTPALAVFLREIGQFRTLNEETPEATRERVGRHLTLCLSDDSHSSWVATGADGALLGYTSVHWLPYLFLKGPEGYVSELFVRESSRGQGVGTALLDAAVAEGRRRGCARMMLINIRDRESYKRGFYKKHGWQEREDAANFVLPL